MAKQKVIIYSDSYSLEDVQTLLTPELVQRDVDAQLAMENPEGAERFVLETAVLVALVSSVSSVISGMLAVAREKRCQHIIVRGRSGWSVEVPADTPPERIEEYLDASKEEEVELVEL
jgi:hypothetical protein